MRNRRVGVTAFWAILAGLAFSALASAAVTEFKDFSLNVPDGWTSNQDGSTVSVVANDKSAAVSITVDKTEGASLKDLAEAFKQRLNGSDPVLEDDVYRFTFTNPAGVESNAILTGDEDRFCLIVITGEHPDLKAMLDSLEEK